jgi:hypothetical protein
VHAGYRSPAGCPGRCRLVAPTTLASYRTAASRERYGSTARAACRRRQRVPDHPPHNATPAVASSVAEVPLRDVTPRQTCRSRAPVFCTVRVAGERCAVRAIGAG